jgi:uncharacterized protein YbjT (DUF2867 family)
MATTATRATVLITGASGRLGRRLLAHPATNRYQVRAITRRVPPVTPADGVRWLHADVATGTGLDAAVAGVDTVVHAATAPRGDTDRTDVQGTQRLVAAARRAGVRHLLYISIVGVDRIPVAYCRAKFAAEQVVRASGLPFTIQRCTQFHDFMDELARQMTRFPIAIVPSGFLCQPIHVDEFVDELWREVGNGPRDDAPDIAGPEVLTFSELVRAWLSARGTRRSMLHLRLPGKLAASMRRGDAIARDHPVGVTRWETWLDSKYRRPVIGEP